MDKSMVRNLTIDLTKNLTSVEFKTESDLIQKLYDASEAKLIGNLRYFGDARVLIEGGGYNKIWLETQPMGGEMYAKRDMEAALNNQLLFMKYQREDGRLPGSIMTEPGEGGKVIPQFNKFQGFCFPMPAFNMYYWLGRDNEYLAFLYGVLERFDEYLWRVRDSDGDGCLESWCVYDTGEDNALRYGDAPCWYEADTPPTDSETVPIASMDVMSFSYSARDVLAGISTILNNGKTALWRSRAKDAADVLRRRLWLEKRGACFDRDKHGRIMPTLTHNNLRCMYWGSFSQNMADRFVNEHLLNPHEFWTALPLPSVAANDPLFRNNPGNDWSGQPQGLTYQRAIRALDNYGYPKLVTELGLKLFQAIGEECVFTQQFDPFKCKPSAAPNSGEAARDGYGPTMLAVLEYISRLYGVHPEGDEIWWGALGGDESEYTQQWGGRIYKIRCNGRRSEGMLNGKTVFSVDAGVRVITDYEGRILRSVDISSDRNYQ